MMLVKANKDFEAGTPPNPELMAAVAKLADEATARGVMVSFSHIFSVRKSFVSVCHSRENGYFESLPLSTSSFFLALCPEPRLRIT